MTHQPAGIFPPVIDWRFFLPVFVAIARSHANDVVRREERYSSRLGLKSGRENSLVGDRTDGLNITHLSSRRVADQGSRALRTHASATPVLAVAAGNTYRSGHARPIVDAMLGTQTDGEAVPHIDCSDSDRQVGDLRIGKVLAQRFEIFVGRPRLG